MFLCWVLVLSYVSRCPLYSSNHPAEEDGAGSFTSRCCGCLCDAFLPRGAVGWSTECDYDIYWPYLLFDLDKARRFVSKLLWHFDGIPESFQIVESINFENKQQQQQQQKQQQKQQQQNNIPHKSRRVTNDYHFANS